MRCTWSIRIYWGDLLSTIIKSSVLSKVSTNVAWTYDHSEKTKASSSDNPINTINIIKALCNGLGKSDAKSFLGSGPSHASLEKLLGADTRNAIKKGLFLIVFFSYDDDDDDHHDYGRSNNNDDDEW